MSLLLLVNLTEDYFRRLLPIVVWYRLAKIKRFWNRRDYSEVTRTNSKDEQPLFYVIRREPPGAGLFSNLNHALQGFLEAEKRGLTPVIDAQNYWTTYSLSAAVKGTRNSWEYFFDQPTNYSLSDAYKSKRYVLSKGNRIAEDHWLAQKSLEYVLNPDKVAEINRILSKHLKLNSFTKSAIDCVKEKIDWAPQELLGVSLRGTDYLLIEPKGHPKQPNMTDVYKEIENALKKEPRKRIFLACEDHKIRSSTEREFPGLVLPNFREMDFFRERVSKELNLSGRNLQVMTNSLGYLIEIILFSECKTCVCSLANGSVFGIALNKSGVQNHKILSLGVY